MYNCKIRLLKSYLLNSASWQIELPGNCDKDQFVTKPPHSTNCIFVWIPIWCCRKKTSLAFALEIYDSAKAGFKGMTYSEGITDYYVAAFI